jgi:putative transposase
MFVYNGGSQIIMRHRKRYSQEEIARILKEAEAGFKIIDICRNHEISEQTFYNWRKKYGGSELKSTRKLKTLEEENKKLKLLIAELSLDNYVLKNLLEKSSKRPKQKDKLQPPIKPHVVNSIND